MKKERLKVVKGTPKRRVKDGWDEGRDVLKAGMCWRQGWDEGRFGKKAGIVWRQEWEEGRKEMRAGWDEGRDVVKTGRDEGREEMKAVMTKGRKDGIRAGLRWGREELGIGWSQAWDKVEMGRRQGWEGENKEGKRKRLKKTATVQYEWIGLNWVDRMEMGWKEPYVKILAGFKLHFTQRLHLPLVSRMVRNLA